MNWENRCQREIEIGNVCDYKPRKQADRKTVSVIYLRIGTEERRIMSSHNPHLVIDTITSAELWCLMEKVFTRPRNVTFYCSVLFMTKQDEGESTEHFFGKLKDCQRIVYLAIKTII